MAFNILGINHKTAPVALREKVAFSEDRLVAALQVLRQEMGVAEAVILSTCNRTEVYWSGAASGAELTRWLERHHGAKGYAGWDNRPAERGAGGGSRHRGCGEVVQRHGLQAG